jgi:hypothetical protein
MTLSMQNDIYMQDERSAGLPLIIMLFCTLLDIMSIKGHNSGNISTIRDSRYLFAYIKMDV